MSPLTSPDGVLAWWKAQARQQNWQRIPGEMCAETGFLRRAKPKMAMHGWSNFHLLKKRKKTWVFPKIGGKPPKSSILIRVFHEINHPFWGLKSPNFWFNTHISFPAPGGEHSTPPGGKPGIPIPATNEGLPAAQGYDALPVAFFG